MCFLDYLRYLYVKVKFSLYRPWRPVRLQEVEAPTFSDIRLIDGRKVVSHMRRSPFTPRKMLLISVRGCINPRAIVCLEGLGQLKESTSNGTNDLSDYSIVP
jgi:hypothetical protein